MSYLDFIFAGLAPWRGGRRLTRFMAKDGVFHHKVSGPLMRGMKHIPVDRESGSASFRTALRALKDGEIVGVFPEATISQSFTVKELKSGAVRMAAAAKVPIVPVVVWGGQRLWTKNRPRNLLLRGQTIAISVGEPYTVGTRDDMDAPPTLRPAGTLQAMLDERTGRAPGDRRPRAARLVAARAPRRGRPDAGGGGTPRRRGDRRAPALAARPARGAAA